MKVSQNRSRILADEVCRDDGPVPGSAAGPPNLVIENLTELAAAGVPNACHLSWADCAAVPAPARDGYRSSSWILPTAR